MSACVTQADFSSYVHLQRTINYAQLSETAQTVLLEVLLIWSGISTMFWTLFAFIFIFMHEDRQIEVMITITAFVEICLTFTGEVQLRLPRYSQRI